MDLVRGRARGLLTGTSCWSPSLFCALLKQRALESLPGLSRVLGFSRNFILIFLRVRRQIGHLILLDQTLYGVMCLCKGYEGSDFVFIVLLSDYRRCIGALPKSPGVTWALAALGSLPHPLPLLGSYPWLTIAVSPWKHLRTNDSLLGGYQRKKSKGTTFFASR